MTVRGGSRDATTVDDRRPLAPGIVIEPFGDAALLLTLDGPDSIARAARSQAVARRIRAAFGARPGWGAVVPAASSVLVQVDPRDPGVPAAIESLRAAAEVVGPTDDGWPADTPTIELGVRYGGEGGPDLDDVAAAVGLTAAQVIEAHAATTYRALFLGFAPGFAYLGPVAPALVLPRRSTPRMRVPAGSVGIAGPHTAVYPIESPGGWHLIGRTDAELWSPTRRPPALIEAGALVRFVPERG